MLISMLLSVALATGQAQAAPPPQGDPRAQAEALARSGADRAALERFQAIAAANPDDLEARLWIARLHERMGDSDRAIDVYESIIANSPQHLEALIGLGHALINEGRLAEASDALNRAESLAAENAAVLAAQGRLHAVAGRTTLSLAYYQRAVTIDPNNARVGEELLELQARRGHRVELGYFFEHFNTDIPDPQAGFGTLNLRISDSLRVSGTAQHHRKFSESETRGGGGIEWMLHRSLRVHAGVLVGGDAAILPESDVYGGLGYQFGRATWTFDVRVAEFSAVTAKIGGGGLQVALPQRSAVWVKYYRFDTDYAQQSSDIVHSWVLGGVGRPKPKWQLGVEYTRGPDQLDFLTIDRLGRFDTNTYSVFTDYQFTPMFSGEARYDYQDRPGDLRVHRAGLRIVHRF